MESLTGLGMGRDFVIGRGGAWHMVRMSSLIDVAVVDCYGVGLYSALPAGANVCVYWDVVFVA